MDKHLRLREATAAAARKAAPCGVEPALERERRTARVPKIIFFNTTQSMLWHRKLATQCGLLARSIPECRLNDYLIKRAKKARQGASGNHPLWKTSCQPRCQVCFDDPEMGLLPARLALPHSGQRRWTSSCTVVRKKLHRSRSLAKADLRLGPVELAGWLKTLLGALFCGHPGTPQASWQTSCRDVRVRDVIVTV